METIYTADGTNQVYLRDLLAGPTWSYAMHARSMGRSNIRCHGTSWELIIEVEDISWLSMKVDNSYGNTH